jgi:hypothetical protein
MKLKSKMHIQHKWLFGSKQWSIALLFLFVGLNNAFAAGEPFRKIKLKVGEVLNYQTINTACYDNDTTKTTSWYELKVVDKKDTLYTIVFTHKRQTVATGKTFTDTNHPEVNSLVTPEINQPFPFLLSERGDVQPVVIPDSTFRRKIKQDYRYNLLGATHMVKNNRAIQDVLTLIFQGFFTNWDDVKIGHTELLDKYVKMIDESFQDVSPKKDLSEIIHTYQSKSVSYPFTEYKCTRKLKADALSGVILTSTATTYFNVPNTPNLYKSDPLLTPYPKCAYSELRKYTPVQDSMITLTGTIDKDCNQKLLQCFIYNNFMTSGDIDFRTELIPGKSFKIRTPLHRSAAVTISVLPALPQSLTNFLIEPGDSIHLVITKKGVALSGKGALKNQLYKSFRESDLNLYTSMSESQAKQIALDWVASQEQKLLPYKNQLSGWAYNQIRTDIYYSAMNDLISFYIHKNNWKINTDSFEALFDTVKWDEYLSYSSVDMLAFLQSYLYRKMLILKKITDNRSVSETETYYYANILLKDRIKYVALSLCVYESIKRNTFEESKALFAEYEKSYRNSGYYKLLKSKLEKLIDMGQGAVAPDFEVSDVNGRKISLSNFKGKYVEILFVDLELLDNYKYWEGYQKLKDELPDDKFELITVFVNKNDSLTDAYIRAHRPKGILIKNPDWRIEQLKKYDIENTASYFLLNPEGVIIFRGYFSPLDDLIKIIIETVKDNSFSSTEASVSKRTLYWVLSVSVSLVLVVLVVFILVAKNIKRRETMRREQLELKLSAVRSQLNPHFLFNSMTSIQYLVNHHENEKANLFLSKFAQLMRKVLYQSETERVSLNDELTTIETYLELEALRHRFTYTIQVDNDIDRYNTEIPVMLLQPFVENAIIHGIAQLGVDGVINVHVKRDGSHRLKITITDNGAGYPDAPMSSPHSNGKGMQITQKRIDLMMAKYGKEIEFNVRNRKEADTALQGTEVTITFETEK